MPVEIAHRAIDFGLDQADRGYLHLAFFGGEPLLELSLIREVIAYARSQAPSRRKQLFFSITTNGTILNEEILGIFKEHNFQVQVSLDGCPEAQDATRCYRNGRSSYSSVAGHIQRLLEEGFAVQQVSVVDPRNVAVLGKSFDHLMDLGVRKIYFSPNYCGDWNDTNRSLFEESLTDLGNRYIARFRQHQDVRLDPLNGKIVTHLMDGNKEHHFCSFGGRELAISPSGKIYPCDRVVAEDNNPEVCIGDLNNGGLDVARRDQLVKMKNTLDPECAECELNPRCMYWCGCANYETSGHVGRVSPIICWFERCFIAEADRIANTLFAEKNTTFLRRFYLPSIPEPTQDHDE